MMKTGTMHRTVMSIALALGLAVSGATASNASEQPGPTVVIKLNNTTQGPLWPPSEVVDENGDFVLIGIALEDDGSGGVKIGLNRAVLVSKDTVPPLGPDGKEDFTNPFAAPYKILRELDLSAGSPDLDMVLYASSFGPSEGDFGGGPRVPAEGVSAYNLRADPPPCPEVFPASSQRTTYRRPSFPLHRVPALGYRGDQVAYDVDTGEAYDPRAGLGQDCPPDGCPGEAIETVRLRTEPITLRDYLKAKGSVRISLTRFDEERGAYTHARFSFKFRHLLPSSLYTIWLVREANHFPPPFFRLPDAIAAPDVVFTDRNGHADVELEVAHPFAAHGAADEALRVIGLAVGYHSDHQNWGNCIGRFGPSVDIHDWFNTFIGGVFDFTDFVTVAPR